MIKRWLLERKWAKEREEGVLRIGSFSSAKILTRREKLYNEFLDRQKRKQETKEHLIRLEELDWIIGGCK